MYSFFKKSLPYFLLAACCLAGYIVTKQKLKSRNISKEIKYTSDSASELTMAWCINDKQVPPPSLWPPHSVEDHGVVYTTIESKSDSFSVNISLPYNSILSYRFFPTKDKNGREIADSSASRDNKMEFQLNYYDEGILKPGYFILLAGLLPLLLFYYRNRKNDIPKDVANKKISEYIPQFNSLRAIAVIIVIMYHWLDGYEIQNYLPSGNLGVNIFFVLSGFLITGILFRARKLIELDAIGRSTVLKNFYARRTLRIFPIYYLLLIILWVVQDQELRRNAVYYFTYTSNYLFYQAQHTPKQLGHLWSLAVEEQFYIFWPWLILFVNKKLLPYSILLFFIIGISSNYIFNAHGWWAQLLTPACFDAFAIGAFLSWLIAYRQDILDKIQTRFFWISCAVLALFFLNKAFIPERTTDSLLAIVIIYYCLFKNNSKLVNFFLGNKWLIRIGKISYGAYLFHLFIPALWNGVIKKFASWNIDLLYNQAMPDTLKPAWLFIQYFLFLMLLCIISWSLVEKPFQSLKRRFVIAA